MPNVCKYPGLTARHSRPPSDASMFPSSVITVFHPRTSGSDARFAGVSTDSRAIGRGELFVALRGERFDGHDFLAAAAARGAAAAMVDRDYPGAYPLSVVIVQDTKRALGDLARAWRSRLHPVLIAVTGWGQEADKARAAAAGFDLHFTKPVEPPSLLELLRSELPVRRR